MSTIKTQIMQHLVDKQKRGEHEKKSFWATDSERDRFDIYHAWIGTAPTNPMTVEDSLGLSTRKLFEDSLVNIMDDMGILIKPENTDQHRIEMVREGVPISGYIDALIRDTIDGKEVIVPVEVKTAYGKFNAYDLEAGKPKTSYLKQLCTYMDFLGAEYGHLFIALFDELRVSQVYQFTVEKISNGVYACGDIVINMNAVYKRYAEIYNTYIVPRVEPTPETRYKFDINEIDWTKQSADKISKARNNKAVIGDWQPKYSNYKNLWIQKEGSVDGYTDEEIAIIKEKTKNYTTWKK